MLAWGESASQTTLREAIALHAPRPVPRSPSALPAAFRTKNAPTPSVALLRPARIFRVPWPSPLFRCSARTRATLHSMLEDSPHTRLHS